MFVCSNSIHYLSCCWKSLARQPRFSRLLASIFYNFKNQLQVYTWPEIPLFKEYLEATNRVLNWGLAAAAESWIRICFAIEHFKKNCVKCLNEKKIPFCKSPKFRNISKGFLKTFHEKIVYNTLIFSNAKNWYLSSGF